MENPFKKKQKSEDQNNEGKDTILSKIRNSSFKDKVEKTLAVASVLTTLDLAREIHKDYQKKEETEQVIKRKDNLPEINHEIEFTRSELDSEVTIKEVAENIDKEYCKDFISMIDESLKEYDIEILKRQLTGVSSNDFRIMRTKTILEQIKEFNETKNEYLERIKYTEKSIDSKKFKHFNKENYDKNIKKEFEKIKKLLSVYDAGRKWVLDNINNPEYKKRLYKEEMSSNSSLSKEELENETSVDIEIRKEQALDSNFIISKDIKKSYGKTDNNIGAFYKLGGGSNTVYLPIEADSVEAINYAIHEYSHKVTLGNNLISEESTKLLSNAFDSLSVVSHLSGALSKDTLENILYFSDPTEMYARKKQFDHDLEVLGIKKYEEKFTLNHYLRALKLQKEGKLNHGSSEFLYSIKPKMMIKVMNEIANNQDNKTFYHPGWDYNNNENQA